MITRPLRFIRAEFRTEMAVCGYYKCPAIQGRGRGVSRALARPPALPPCQDVDARMVAREFGIPGELSSDVDRSLTGSLPNGVNNKSLDLPDRMPGPLNLNRDPRNGLLYFNQSLFAPNVLGTPGNASRRSFHGPGMVNFDISSNSFGQVVKAGPPRLTQVALKFTF